MSEFFKNLKFAWGFSKSQKGNFIKFIITNIITIIISVIVPILSAKIIVNLTSNNFYQLIIISIVIFLVEQLNNISSYLIDKYSQLIYRESSSKIQLELGKSILKLENKTIEKYGTGVFIQRITGDTSKLAEIFNVLNECLYGIISSIGIFCAIFLINKIAFIYLLTTIVILFLIERKRVEKYIEHDKIFRSKNEKVSGFFSEIIRGVRDIKMLNSEDSFITSLNSKIKDLNCEKYNMGSVNRTYKLFRRFFSDLVDLLLIILLVVLIVKEKIVMANALIIFNYSKRLPEFAYYVGMLLDKVKDFNLSANRVFDIIESNEFKKETFGLKHLDKVEGDFEFKNVSFGYDEIKVLKNLSFKIKANETVAFVGKSGAGKTTIFNLLCKMYNINKGEIKIDGININELDKDSIRGNITIISQNPYIFNLSIKENLKLVKQNLTDDEMIEACKCACLHDFIMSLPNKYDTVVGEGGVNLSGGQKQRLAIARALVQKTEIILFDEATSALDNDTQEQIQKAIENMKGEYTILIIAHRLSTIKNANRILYLNDGKILAEGTHEQLMNNCNQYKHLYESEIIKNDYKK